MPDPISPASCPSSESILPPQRPPSQQPPRILTSYSYLKGFGLADA